MCREDAGYKQEHKSGPGKKYGVPDHNTKTIQQAPIMGSGSGSTIIWNKEEPKPSGKIEQVDFISRIPDKTEKETLSRKAERPQNSCHSPGSLTETASAGAVDNTWKMKILIQIRKNIMRESGILNMYKRKLESRGELTKEFKELFGNIDKVISMIFDKLIKQKSDLEKYWGIQAIADEVSKIIFKKYFPQNKGNRRPNIPYLVEYPEHFEGALHHLVPWSQLSQEKIKEEEKEEKEDKEEEKEDKEALRCWQEDNLLAGPAQERIYDPGSNYDYEAEFVWTNTKEKVSTKTIKDRTGESKTRTQNIRIESAEFHMRTSWLERIYLDINAIIDKISNYEDQKKLGALEDGDEWKQLTKINQQILSLSSDLLKAAFRFKEIEIEFHQFEAPLKKLQEKLKTCGNASKGSISLEYLLGVEKELVQCRDEIKNLGEKFIIEEKYDVEKAEQASSSGSLPSSSSSSSSSSPPSSSSSSSSSSPPSSSSSSSSSSLPGQKG